jgi:hypothetical protein
LYTGGIIETDRLTFLECVDGNVFIAGEIIPTVADVGEFRVNELFEDVRV